MTWQAAPYGTPFTPVYSIHPGLAAHFQRKGHLSLICMMFSMG